MGISFKTILLILLIFPLIGSCVTPQTKKVDNLSQEKKLFSDVQFTLDEHFEEKGIKCIAVGNLRITDENSGYPNLPKEKLVRQAIIGNLTPKKYKALPLEDIKKAVPKTTSEQSTLALQKCDALIIGDISAFRNDNVLFYSDTVVGLNLQMKDGSGNLLWSGRHRASSKKGTIPFSPFSLISGLIASYYNSENEIAFQMVDAVSRRLVDTIPNGDYINLNFGSAENAIYSLKQSEPGKTKAEGAGMAAKLLEKGKINKALETARFAIGNDDNLLENYTIGAKAASMLQQHELAIEYYLEAIAIEQTTEGLTGLSLSYLKSGQSNMARASMLKAVLSSPEDLVTRLRHGLLLEAIKAPEDAAKAYYKAGELAYRDNDLENLYKALMSLKRLHNHGEAIQYYNVLLRKSKNLTKN